MNLSGGTGTKYAYSKDHLGSIREVTSGNGTFQVKAQYAYNPWGMKTNVISETVASDFGYASMYKHERSGLNLTLFRAYAPNTMLQNSRLSLCCQ